METEKLTYEQAVTRLEALAREMEQGAVPIDEMADRLREAQGLIKQCRAQLYAADEAVKGLLDEEDAAAARDV